MPKLVWNPEDGSYFDMSMAVVVDLPDDFDGETEEYLETLDEDALPSVMPRFNPEDDLFSPIINAAWGAVSHAITAGKSHPLIARDVLAAVLKASDET